jgi:O-antigen ligase
MHANLSSYAPAEARIFAVAISSATDNGVTAAKRGDHIEPLTFWLFVAGLAWLPLWYGSNDLVAWGINAVLFPGLAASYEISILVRGRGHPVAIRHIGMPAALFAAVVGWIFLQTMTWEHGAYVHPIWGMASEALAHSLPPSISVNRDLTILALIRLITAASVFWLALQLCRNAERARRLIEAIAVIGCLYAGYGMLALASTVGRLPWLETPATAGLVTATFVNHNSYATYAGLGMIAICGLILRLYRRQFIRSQGSRRLTIAILLETTGRSGAALLGGAFLLMVAILLTGSRGGVIAVSIGLIVLCTLTMMRPNWHGQKSLIVGMCGASLALATLFAFGDIFLGALAERGFDDSNRIAIYLITLRSILDAPLSGFGYGTFADVFSMYRDRSLSVQGAWQQAHNTYLEIFQGLGLVFGSMLVGGVLLLVLRCFRGAVSRVENAMVPCVAASMACMVGAHALVDFSLQMQAVTLTFVAALGAGVAQSESSRSALEDV